MLKLVLFGAVLTLAMCGLFRLPHDIDLAGKVQEYESTDSVPSEIVKEWLLDEIKQRDPDIAKHKDMIEHFFTETFGTSRLAVSTLHDKIKHFLKNDFVRKVETMQEYLIRLYGTGAN